MNLFRTCLLIGLAVICCSPQSAEAQDRQQDRAAIQKAIESYVGAFNAQDAQSLANHWSPNGVYTSRDSGEHVTGRDNLVEQFAKLFDEGEIKLSVQVDSIEFLSPSVALERGTATVVASDSAPAQTSYTVVHVKHDGNWLIDRVSEEEIPGIQSNYEHLKELEFLIGKWVDAEGGEVVTTECSWARNQNFLTRSFAVAIEDRVDMAGMQIIGWDAARQQVRSWVFDSDGGFAEGEWTKHGDRWIVQTTATLPDGRRGSATSIIRRIDDEHIGWQRINRLLDGDILPNIEEVIIVRQAS